MKLRPHLFVAAALAMAASAYAGTISINFGADRASLATATESAGAIVVGSPNWNNASNKSGTLNALKDGTGAVTGASVAWTSPNTWQSKATDVVGNDNGILTRGYLDDGTGYTATLTRSYFLSNVYLILATDSNSNPTVNVTLGGYKVNGITYGWDGTATVAGVNTWGTANSWSNAATLIEGKNYLKVPGIAGTVAVTGTKPSGGRSALAGLQVEDAYTGTLLHWDINGTTAGAGGATPSGTWDGATSNWSTDATGSSGTSTWGADNVAVFSAGTDATGSYTITVDGTQSARGLWLQEGSVIFTGGTINLTDERTIVIDSGTLTLSSALTADGVVQVSTAPSTSLTLNNGSFAGTFAVNGTGGTVNLGGNYALGGMVGAGVVNLGANTLTINGAEDTSYAGVLSGSGALAKQGSGTFTLNNNNNSFSGNVTVSGGTLDTGTSQGGGTNSYLGAVNGSRTVTISNGASVVLQANNVFGGSGKTAATIPAMVVDGATLNTARFNIVGNVTLNGGALVDSIPAGTDSANYDGFQFLGSVTVGGSAPSTISTTTARGNHLLGGGTTTFDVADVTGDAAVDLTVSTKLHDGSNDYKGIGSLAKGGTGTMLLTAANTYTGSTTINAGTIEIGGTGSLGNGSYAGDISNSGTLVISSTASQTLGGVLSGTGHLTKTAASTGRLMLTNASPAYTGTITVNAGTIGGTGSVAGPLVIDGGSIAIAGGATTTSLTTDGVNFAASTPVVLDSAMVPSTVYDVLTYGAGGATNPGNLWVAARGTLADTGTKFTFTAGAVATRTWATTDGVWDNYQTTNFAEDDQKFSAGDTVVFNDPATPSTVTLGGTLTPASVTVTNTNDYIFSGSGIISGAATLAKAGSGTVTINTANTYSGGTTISAGTVMLGNASALGSGAVALNGGTLNLGGQTIANAITAGGGTLGGTGTASGAITGAGGVVVDSDGIVTFNNRKEYTGGTTIDEGVLDLTGGGGSGGTIRGTVTVNNGGTLRLGTGDATGYSGGADALTVINLVGGTLDNNQDARLSNRNQTLGSATVNMTGGAITGIEGSNLDFFGGASALNTLASPTTSTISGTAIDLRQSEGVTFTVADGAAAIDLDISSMITNRRPTSTGAGTGTSHGDNPLIKAGDGTMRISGTANNYTGNTTVAAGVLVVDGSIAASTLTTVNSGATLAGTGTVGTLTVSGALAPGNSAGTLSVVGDVVLDNGSSLDWELDGGDNTTGGGVNDLLAISGTGTGNLTLDGTLNVAALNSNPFSSLGFDAHWTIITYTGTLTDNGLELGVMPSLPEGWGWQVDTTSQPGEVWLVVPEPSAALLGLLGVLGLLRRRRN